MPEPDAEDAKLGTLARAALARSGAPQGAAVRDRMGRTYTGVTVALPTLRLTAVQAAVAAAVASGADGLEAAAVAGGALTTEDLAVVRDLGGAGTPVLVFGADGTLRETASA